MDRLTGSQCRCPACGAYFASPMPRDRHLVYNAALSPCWDKWCLSELAMEAIGMVWETWYGERVWAVPFGGLEGPP
jgi:hypothetical protein